MISSGGLSKLGINEHTVGHRGAQPKLGAASRDLHGQLEVRGAIPESAGAVRAPRSGATLKRILVQYVLCVLWVL